MPHRLLVASGALCVGLLLYQPSLATVDPLFRSTAVPGYSVEDFQQYRLYAACKPTKLVIDHTSPAAHQAGLTEEVTSLVAESFLRRANIATLMSEQEPAWMRTVIFVGDSKVGTEITLRFMKMLWDALSNKPGYSSTWDKTVIVPYGQDTNKQFLSALSGLLKSFIVEYAEQNTAACS